MSTIPSNTNPAAPKVLSELSTSVKLRETEKLVHENAKLDIEDVHEIADGAVDAKAPEIARKAPGYRGAFSEAGYADGSIGGVQMNLGDWVYYNGPDEAGWFAGYVYQWNGSWVQTPRPSSGDTSAGWMYLAAAKSIGDGMPVGVFSDLYCQALVFIDGETGLLKAIGAIFENIMVDQNSSFYGNIEAGPLIEQVMQTVKQ